MTPPIKDDHMAGGINKKLRARDAGDSCVNNCKLRAPILDASSVTTTVHQSEQLVHTTKKLIARVDQS
ncbi:hypothetical protein T265_05168 [Opisthorchis viverrini]|uniref:Uncharacterized protein n=1 Tax=Opisthorchis viverrini TaxID=6198 RepID=A0A074ZKN1_OPIVI|nr:hypothetical protein T265_05168 [Opisthorchis viverrini]KER27888.1 hypothetical protein T265_05168 [Opisthorchis viverrini]